MAGQAYRNSFMTTTWRRIISTDANSTLCQFNLEGITGNPLKKGWKIASDVRQLCVLDDCVCHGSHVHEQPRGKALKNAEGYELTDVPLKLFAAEQSRTTQFRAFRRLSFDAMSQPERRYSDHQLALLDGWDALFQRLLRSAICRCCV